MYLAAPLSEKRLTSFTSFNSGASNSSAVSPTFTLTGVRVAVTPAAQTWADWVALQLYCRPRQLISLVASLGAADESRRYARRRHSPERAMFTGPAQVLIGAPVRLVVASSMVVYARNSVTPVT